MEPVGSELPDATSWTQFSEELAEVLDVGA
jgi:hypothetical protein